MSAMEAMAVNVLSKMIGMEKEEMAEKINGLLEVVSKAADNAKMIDDRTAEILAKLEGLENVNRNRECDCCNAK